MSGIEPPRCRDSRHEITIETEGRLPLPPELIRNLSLTPGDIVALEPLGDTVSLRFYRQILTVPKGAMSPEARWSFARQLLSLSLTALDETGDLAIPPDVLRLPAGGRRVLRVTALYGASWPLVCLTAPAGV